MPKGSDKWTLAKLIDFETVLLSWDGKAAGVSRGGKSRREIFKTWLQAEKSTGPGDRWVASLSLAGSVLALLFLALGAIAAWGTLNRQLGGIHVVWFMFAALIIPWAALLFGVLGWMFRGRVAGLGVAGLMIERTALRFAGPSAREVIERLRGSGELAKVLGWRIARLSQLIAAAFHVGALAGLASMVLFKRVGFYWETTTEDAMENLLVSLTQFLAAPWSWILPWAIPDVVGSKRGPAWDGGGESWWPFLLLALLVWGLLPRLILAGFAAWKECQALKKLTFQAPQHRKLWRALTKVKRGEEPSGPVDGALLIVLGGAEPDRELLRPFLLRKLRLNPTAWESFGVLDEGREAAARAALEKAPAGIVLLAEAWSLAPRQMEKALAEVASRAGQRRVVVLVGNPLADGAWTSPTDSEREHWGRFMDGRKGDETELVFYEEVER